MLMHNNQHLRYVALCLLRKNEFGSDSKRTAACQFFREKAHWSLPNQGESIAPTEGSFQICLMLLKFGRANIFAFGRQFYPKRLKIKPMTLALLAPHPLKAELQELNEPGGFHLNRQIKGIVHPKMKLMKMYSPSGLVTSTGLEKCNITSLSQQWILCSEWVPSE